MKNVITDERYNSVKTKTISEEPIVKKVRLSDIEITPDGLEHE
jgi:hypothetical protein